jgi:N-ethylmaleimide reductase
MSIRTEVSFHLPTAIGSIDIANRIAMAPLTSSRAYMESVHSVLAIEHYRQRARTGLMISEGANVPCESRGCAYTPGICTKAQIAVWRKVTDAVHAAGGKIVCQLWHAGRMSHASLQERDEALLPPAGIYADDQLLRAERIGRPSIPCALEVAEIERIIAAYGHAAQCANDAGFDGIEVQVANWDPLEFIRSNISHRSDEYADSVESHTRILIDAIKAVSEVWGGERVGVFLSPWAHLANDTMLEVDPESSYFHLAEQLGNLGLAYLHCVGGRTRGDSGAVFDFKKLQSTCGGKNFAIDSYGRQIAIGGGDKGQTDMVSFGRPFISNLDLIERLRREGPQVQADRHLRYGGAAMAMPTTPN